MDILANAHRLPVLDWSLNFFGGHEQSVADNWAVPLNKHQAFELIYVLKGQEGLNLGEREILINAHEFVLIPPGFEHTCHSVEHLTYFCFHFDIDEPDFIVHLIQSSPIYFPQNHPINKQITPILDKMDHLIRLNRLYSFDDKMKLQIYFSQFLSQLNSLTKLNTSETNSNKSRYAKVISERIKSKINDHVLYYTNPSGPNKKHNIPEIPKITDLIDSLQISPGYGNRVFKEVYGISPREYMSKLKMRWAQQMLAKPQFTIAEIAQALGYQNPTHFSRQYKRWTGISPKNYQ